MSAVIQIKSREQLLGALGEAAEIEHNLMCCYLYALFSLKSDTADEFTEEEVQAIRRWRRVILGVAMEEMTHLTLVANLISALGSQPHFLRPNFPVSPGLYPTGVVIELAPFDLDTLTHFIFLERPHGASVTDGSSFIAGDYARGTSAPRLMPFGGEYATVGDLYAAIGEGLKQLTDHLGEDVLLCGDPSLQIRPTDAALPQLVAVEDLASALRALDTIVIQGEGSTTDGDSHYARFSEIKVEYLALLRSRPTFVPARPVARNPVMRPPPISTGRLHITAEPAASLIDLANAVYVMMLRLLQQLYAVTSRSPVSRRALLRSASNLMRVIVVLGERLTHLPACKSIAVTTSGMSFATIRMLQPLEPGPVEAKLMGERIAQMLVRVSEFAENDTTLAPAVASLQEVQALLAKLDVPFTEKAADEPNPATLGAPDSEEAAESQLPTKTTSVENAAGKDVDIEFEARRCIHSRGCVLALPQVFLANTPGQWLRPDTASAESLVAVAENCPSGAIRYRRHDGGPQETQPLVNTLHMRENGPLALRAPLVLRGQSIGFRATMCRCGRSKNKPFCDGSHVGTFVASGEAPTGDTTALAVRDGALLIDPQANGPLQVSGNLELCTGTGRTIARITEARLCRCGGSHNKPFCDSSHVSNGFIAD